MKGLKSKILIAVIMILSIVLGYQASVMALGETFPRTSNSVPFWSNGHLILCREHTNGWQNCWSYTCQSEYTINPNGTKVDGHAHGMAYFLHFASKYGIDYGNEIQSWIWNRSAQWQGGEILHAGSLYKSFFDGANVDSTEIENFLNTNFKDSLDKITAIEQENKSLKDALESKTASVVDSYSDKFFTKVSGKDMAEENDTRITEISAEEYNYLYQLVYVFDFIDDNKELSKTELENKLKQHINKYQAEMGMTIYDGSIPADTKNSELPAVSSSITKDFYGSNIKLTKIDHDGNGEPNAVMWQYVDENNNVVDENVYFADDSYGTKFSNRVLLTEDKENKDYTMLSNYINLYDGTYAVDELIKALRNYSEKQDGNISVTFKDLATKLEKTCKGKKGKELYDALYGLLVGYKKDIDRIAEKTMTQEEVSGAEIKKDPSKNKYTFTGTTAQAAKVYQWLVDNNVFEKCANRFQINSSDAKVSVDRANKEYIMGPFSVDYFAISINGKNLLEMEDFKILLDLDNTKNIELTKVGNKKVFKVGNETIEFDDETPFDLITSSDSNTPNNGEAFYIKLSQDALKEIIAKVNPTRLEKGKDYLTQNDYLGARVQYKYLESISATIHFLQGTGADSDDARFFNRNHPQRLMTFDTKDNWKSIVVDAHINPETYEFEVIKVDQDGNRLKGAEFALFGRYESGSEEIYVNLVNNEVSKGTFNETNKTFTVLDKVETGNYVTGDKGTINISNVPSHIVHNGKDYILHSVVGKETKAPDENTTPNYTHFEITKEDNQVARGTIVNTRMKPYDIVIKKVDENGNPIADLKIEYLMQCEKKNEYTGKMQGEIKTNSEGVAVIKDINIRYKDTPVDLILSEIPSTEDEYQYFKSIWIKYIPHVDEDGNVTLEFYNSDDCYKGVKEIRKVDGEKLQAEATKNDVKCGEDAGKDIDIKIRNEKIIPYNIELLKFDENGKQSDYLGGTKFILEIANSGSTIKTPEVVIKNGIARIEGIKSYDDEVRIYIKETPNLGFKTKLDGKIPVVRYKANSNGEIEIIRYNELELNPAGVSTETYKPVEFDKKTMTLRLGIINETEEYSLKFRKTDEKGNPLQGATFTLAEKDENGELVAIGTDTSDEDTGYMTYKGLTKTGNVTLYLYEESAPEGYLSVATKENPLEITYKYEPGSGKLTNFVVKHNGEKLEEDIPEEFVIETDEAGNLGTLNSIFNLVNTPEYDLELFTKVDKNGNPIPDVKFNVSIYSKDEKNQTVYAKYKDKNGEIKDIHNITVESNKIDGKVIIEDVKTYGKLYLEINEIKDSKGNYETLNDTLIFNFTSTPKAGIVWGDTLSVSDKIYVLDAEGIEFIDENNKENKYPYAMMEKTGAKVILKIINEQKPYNLVIKKVNSVDGKPIPGVSFTAVVFKNLTSERQTFGGITNENGEIVLEGITIYNNADDDRYTDRLSVSITETVPEGYKWHEYGQVTYMQDYLKYSSNGDIEPLTGLITARTTDEEGNPAIKVLEKLEAGESIIAKQANEKSHDVVIRNTPVYDLDLFMKAIATKSELQAIIGKQEIDFSDVVANSGIKFTAEVYMDGVKDPIHSGIKVTFDENGIVAHDIDTSSLFTNNTTEVKGLKLVLTEIETSGLVKIDPITIVYDCKYVDGKFEPTKTGYEYQNKLYELKDFANKNVEIIKDLIYIDNEGKHVLVNESKTSEIILKKFDEKGNAINGVKFEGKIKDVNGVEQGFVVTTGEAGIDGEAVITNITLTGDVTLIITDESWKGGQMPEGMNYSELEFIKDDITISGIVINADKTADCSNAKVDDTHKEQVKINESTMAIEVTNKDLTYDIPMIKTSESDEPLDEIMFNFIIRDEGALDNDSNNLYFNNIETKPDGRMDLTKINKFGSNLVLVINEVYSEHTEYKMLDKPLHVKYSAIPNYDTNKVEVEIFGIEYADGSNASEDVKVLYDENGAFLGIQVVNHREYSITLHKIMNINDNQSELNNEKVRFKGFATTDYELVREVANMNYDDFNAYIDEKATDMTETTIYFNQETEVINGESIVKINELDMFEDRVYVYFIEELQDKSSMTLIKEVLNVSFVYKSSEEPEIGKGQEDKLYFNKDNLDVEITVENDASAYKLNFLKVDSKGKPVDSLEKAKFKFTLKEINDNATKDVDTAIIILDDDGQIDYNKSTKGEKYIVDFRLTNDGYIQLDINKFGNLQLEVEELAAPNHYITNENTFVIPYIAEPGKVTIGNGVSEGLTVKVDEIGIEVKLPNDEEPYDLPIYKVLKEDIKNEEGEKANNIAFDVKFFNTNFEPIMGEWSRIYTTGEDGIEGAFEVEKITQIGEYYITLEEINTGNKNIKPIPGIHVFKITAEARDTVDENKNVNKEAVKSIEYIGEGKLEQDKLKLTNYKSYADYFSTSKTDKLTGEKINRLEISNKKPVPYSLDLLKYCDTKNNPLNGVEFEAYLTQPDEDYMAATNLLGDKRDDYIHVTGEGENVKDGQIIFSNLELYGKYKLTLVETKWPSKVKQTFDTVEIIYSTEDGKEIKVESIKVYYKGQEVKADEVVSTSSNKASLEISIKNIEENPVPLFIKKVKYTNVRNEKGELVKQEVPVAGAMFSGTVTAEGEDPQTFNNKLSDKNGKVDLGEFYINGKVTVHIDEIIAPAGAGTIPPTDIYINVNNDEKKVDSNNWSQAGNVVESIENNTFKIIDPEIVNPYITLAGMVWEDVKQHTKGEDSYQDKDTADGINFTEGLYDVGYDRPMEDVKVILHQEGSKKTYETVTNDAGQYVFEDLNPFGKYYITFNYANKEDQEKQYESVKYLVQDSKGTEYTGELKNALEKAIQNNTDGENENDIWARNSKAVTSTEKYQESTATTTQSNLPIGKAGAAIQYYPVQDMFTIDDEQVTLWKKDGKYYTAQVAGSTKVTYSPLNPSHQHINLGLKLKATFDLSLTKDVEQIAAYINGVTMNWKYGRQPEASMFELPLTQADIEALGELYIKYKIEVVNEGETEGTLEEIADYYNSELLTVSNIECMKVTKDKKGEEVITSIVANVDMKDSKYNMIPVQTYSTKNGIDKSTAAKTGQAMITINADNQNVKPGEKVVIYITYKYNQNPLSTDGKFYSKDEKVESKPESAEYVTLGIAEIFSSNKDKIFDKDSTAGDLGDKFSINANKDFNKFYEPNEKYYYTNLNPESMNGGKIKTDDEDTAPALKFVVDDSKGHTVSGTVFDDQDGNNILTETGKLDPTIKGILVELYDETRKEIVQKTTTNENGLYRFTSVPAGKYKIKFTYGDENTVLPKLEKQEENGNITFDEGTITIDGTDYSRNNEKSYNALEFASIDKEITVENEYWYTDKERKSDAADNQSERDDADNFLKNTSSDDEFLENTSSDKEILGIMDNELAEKMNSYKADLNKSDTAKKYVKELAKYSVTAETPTFKLNVGIQQDGNIVSINVNELQYFGETDKGDSSYTTNEEGVEIATPTNIDFGIKGREQSKLEVKKEVDSIKIIGGSDNRVVVNVKYNPNTKKLEGTGQIVKLAENSEGTYPLIELDEESIIGATLEVTYKITVTNNAKESMWVTVADYIQDEITYDVDKNKENGWKITAAKTEKPNTEGAKSTLTLFNKNGELDDTTSVKINNKIDLTTVQQVVTQEIELNEENNYEDSRNIILSTKLSDFDGMPEFENYVEVIQTVRLGDIAIKDAYSIPGNYDPVNKETTKGNIGYVTEIDKTGLEKDTAKAEFAIAPETGENRETYYILAISIIAVFAVGIILIKKKVLDK